MAKNCKTKNFDLGIFYYLILAEDFSILDWITVFIEGKYDKTHQTTEQGKHCP